VGGGLAVLAVGAALLLLRRRAAAAAAKLAALVAAAGETTDHRAFSVNNPMLAQQRGPVGRGASPRAPFRPPSEK